MTEYVPPEDDVDLLVKRAQDANTPAECERIRSEIARIAKAISADLDCINRVMAENRRIEKIFAQSTNLDIAKKLDLLVRECAEYKEREMKLQKKSDALLSENAQLIERNQKLLETNSKLNETIRDMRAFKKNKSNKTKSSKKNGAAKAPQKSPRRVTLADAKRRVIKS